MVTRPFNLYVNLSPLVTAGLITGGSSLLGSLFGSSSANATQKKLLQMQIQAQKEANEFNVAAQKEMNAANIASQEKVNQQQIDMTKEINSLMRHDSKHAISDKRSDLMRAGYSTADPNLNGFSAAALSSPSLTAPQGIAPQVDPTISPEMVNTLISGKSTQLRSIMDMFQTASDVALKYVQTKKTGAEFEGLTKSNAWIDLKEGALYNNILQTTENLVEEKKLTVKKAEQISQDLLMFDVRYKTASAQLETITTTNKGLGERLHAELQSSLATIANLNANTDLAKVNKEIADIKRNFDKYKYDLAKMGINFDSNSLFDSIARIFASPDAGQTPAAILDGFKQVLSGIVEELGNLLSKPISSAAAAVKGVVDGVKDRVASFFE